MQIYISLLIIICMIFAFLSLNSLLVESRFNSISRLIPYIIIMIYGIGTKFLNINKINFFILILCTATIILYIKKYYIKNSLNENMTFRRLIVLTVPSLILFIEPLTKVTLGHPDNTTSLTIIMDLKSNIPSATPPGILYIYQFFEQISFGSLSPLYLIALVNLIIYLSLITTIYDYFGFRVAIIFSLILNSSFNYLLNTELRQTLHQNFSIFVLIIILFINVMKKAEPTTIIILYFLLGNFQIYVSTIMAINILIIEIIRGRSFIPTRYQMTFILGPIVMLISFLFNMINGTKIQSLINTILISLELERGIIKYPTNDRMNLESTSNTLEKFRTLKELINIIFVKLIEIKLDFGEVQIATMIIIIIIWSTITFHRSHKYRDIILYFNLNAFLISAQNISGILELNYFKGRLIYLFIMIIILLISLYISSFNYSTIWVLSLFILSNTVYPQKYNTFYDERRMKEIYEVVNISNSKVCVSDIQGINFINIESELIDYDSEIDFNKIQCTIFIFNKEDNLINHYNYLFMQDQINRDELIKRVRFSKDVRIKILKNQKAIYEQAENNGQIKIIIL